MWSDLTKIHRGKSQLSSLIVAGIHTEEICSLAVFIEYASSSQLKLRLEGVGDRVPISITWTLPPLAFVLRSSRS